jgi:Transcriptional regulator, AbiEi antitoxin, Type IV TA system/Transcriptional regulator, AbiEi antitoxin N-terminal domain
MIGQNRHKINRLETELPEGLLVDATWLRGHGYSRQLQHHYVATGRLEQPARGLFRRPRGSLTWQQVVISLQTLLLRKPLTVGGRTALELQGYAHYLRQHESEVHLYGPAPPPAWLSKLRLDVRFAYHNSEKLFRNVPATLGTTSLKWDVAKNDHADIADWFTIQPWGQWNWPLTLSTPERAVFELMDELPDRESFHQVDDLFQGFTNLRPDRLKKLLADCKNVKAKRLFFFFADRHKHAWLKRLNKSAVDLGKGNRVLVKGGKLDRTYQITVPEDLNGVQ